MAKKSTPTSLEAIRHAIAIVEKDGPLANLDLVWRAVADQYSESVKALGLSATDFPSLTHSTIRNRCISNEIIPQTPAGKARPGSIFNTVEKESKPVKAKASDIRTIAITLLDDDNGISNGAFEELKPYFPADVVEKAYQNETTKKWYLRGDDAESLLNVGKETVAETAPITSNTTEASEPAEATDEATENVAAAMAAGEAPIDSADDDFQA